MEKAQEPKSYGWVPYVLLLITGVIIGWLLTSKINCGNAQIAGSDTAYFPKAVFIFEKEFIHDTIRDGYVTVNPRQTDYKEPFSDDTTLGVEVVPGGVNVIENKADGDLVQFYSDRFLKNNVKNPKLIRSKLAKKLLSFDFLRPDGYPFSVTYPIDLENYTYTWELGGLKATMLHRAPTIKVPKLTFESYGYLTYNPFFNNYRLAIDGTIQLGKVGITAYSGLTTNTSQPFDFRIGTRYRIK